MKKSVKVLFIHDSAYPLFPGGDKDSRYGGAEIQLYSLANELAKSEALEVSWLFLRKSKKEIAKISHPRIKIRAKTPAIRRGVPLLSRVINNFRNVRPYVGYAPDIIVATTGFGAIHLERESKIVQAKTLFRVASDSDLTKPRASSKELADEILAAIPLADHVVAVTQDQINSLSKIRSGPATLIPKYIDFLDVPATQSPKEKVLWIGTSRAVKQPWYFIELAAQFPGEQFVMIMPTVTEGIKYNMDILASRIDNLEYITTHRPKEEIYRHFSEAKLLVSTSIVESMPNVFLEACSASVPILSLSVNPDDFINRYKLGGCADGSFLKFTQLFQDLISDEEELSAMGKRAKSYIVQNHIPKDVISKWESLLISIAQEDELLQE